MELFDINTIYMLYNLKYIQHIMQKKLLTKNKIKQKDKNFFCLKEYSY